MFLTRGNHVILLASLMVLCVPQCQAGTGGIFSSSTSPRRKIQQIQPIESPTSLPNRSVVKPATTIPPSPGTVFFDTKKSGKPDGDLNADKQMHELQQTLSGSNDSSGANSANPTGTNEASPKTTDGEAISKNGSKLNVEVPLRGLSGSASVNSQGTGSIDSFFQMDSGPVGRSSNSNLPERNAVAKSQSTTPNSAETTRSAGIAPLRFLWHVMDNAGVPMFFGNKDDDLDPSLRQGYTGSTVSRTKAAPSAPVINVGTAGSAVTAPSQGPHKIPESELEGTDSWVKDNEQMP
ncbi:MAG TPA: hypothetical protein V6C89_10635 [Drouetiella sp.]